MGCAVRMFMDKPWVGHGPGTYMFLYAPYQRPSEKTIISTNGGNRGNAHGEYLSALCESGALGLLTFLGLLDCDRGGHQFLPKNRAGLDTGIVTCCLSWLDNLLPAWLSQ